VKKIIKVALRLIAVTALIFITVVLLFYFFQEKILFYPQKLSSDYVFDYVEKYEEIYIETRDNIKLHGLLFKADSSRGLVFYLHGNAGSLSTWGRVAQPFLANNYDCFVLDYRGYGKSEGEISSEEQFLSDVNTVYQQMVKLYDEDNVIVVGYSIGTGPAAYLTTVNNPSRLILKAPYNNMIYMLQLYYSWLPEAGLRYKLTTDDYLLDNKLPVIIFHGDNDTLIPYKCSLELQEAFDDDDHLITLHKQGHNGISKNTQYLTAIDSILIAE